MVKLAFPSAIGALISSTIALGTTGASRLQHPAPLARYHIQRHSVQEKLRSVAPPPSRRRAEAPEEDGERNRGDDVRGIGYRRQAAESNNDVYTEDCPGAPFLWKIIEDATGSHVGFGLGTMHLPLDVVLTDRSYGSILAAVEDSCDVFGEINVHDAEVIAGLLDCVGPPPEDSATVADIPDEDLRGEFEAKIAEVAADVAGEGNADLADAVASIFLDLPLSSVQEMIAISNTPEYRDQYLETISTGAIADSLDAHILSLGRPADGLEETSTQCDVVEAVEAHGTITVDDMDQNFDLIAPLLEESLTASLSNDINNYKCGNIDTFDEEYEVELGNDTALFDILLTDRNIQMAAEMNGILKASPGEKVLFAVGAAHWGIGNHSFEILLKDYGYSLEHIPSWDSEQAENPSNEQCGVIWDAATGLFVPAPVVNMTDILAQGEDETIAPSTSSVLTEGREETNAPSTSSAPTGQQNSNSSLSAPPTNAPSIVDDTNSPTKAPVQDTNSPSMVPSGLPSGGVEGVNKPSSSTMIGFSTNVLLCGFIFLAGCT